MSYRKRLYFRMSRLRRLLESRRIFFVTTHFASEALPIAHSEFAIILQSLAETRVHRKFLLLAYCLMPTHLHLLVAPSDDDRLSSVMREIKIRSAKRMRATRKTDGVVASPLFRSHHAPSPGAFGDPRLHSPESREGQPRRKSGSLAVVELPGLANRRKPADTCGPNRFSD